MSQMNLIDGMLNLGPNYRGDLVFPHARCAPGARFTAGSAVLKPDGLNVFRGVLQGKVAQDFSDEATAILAALKEGESAVDSALDGRRAD